MSRHRNVRSMNYSEECEGFDDVYGHSVEDDYCVSPSVAEQFIYDRSRRPQMSAFLGQEEEIAEEDEEEGREEEQSHGIGGMPKCATMTGARGLSDLDHARLQSCLEEVRNVIGDSIAEQTVIEAVLSSDFNVEKALHMVLNNATGSDQSGALKMVKGDQRKEKDVYANCDSYSSTSVSNNDARVGSGVHPTEGAISNSFTQRDLPLAESVLPCSPQGVKDTRREGDSLGEVTSIVSTNLNVPKLTLPSLHPMHSDSEDEDGPFPSLCSLVIHNTSTTPCGEVPSPHGEAGMEESGSEKGSLPATGLCWVGPRTETNLRVETADDSEESADEFSSLCSLVVHNRSKKGPMFSKDIAPLPLPPLFVQKEASAKAKVEDPPRPMCPSNPSSEEDEDDFSSLHSLVIRNRSTPFEGEVERVHHEPTQSRDSLPEPTIGTCAGGPGLISQLMEIGESESEEDDEDNYSSLCSLVIHNRSTHSESLDSKVRAIPPGREAAPVVPVAGSGGRGCASEDGLRSGSFIIPPLLVMAKGGGGMALTESCAMLGSEGSEEEEDYVIDLCGTLRSLDVDCISSSDVESESQDVPTSTKHPSEVEDSGKKEIKWRILEEGWVRKPVKGMMLLDVNSRNLSPFGRVLCRNWECLKQLECPGKREAGTVSDGATLAFLFDKESPDDICRRVRSHKYLVQVNPAKVTS